MLYFIRIIPSFTHDYPAEGARSLPLLKDISNIARKWFFIWRTNVTEENRERPWYTGMFMHTNKEGGFSLWLPEGWYQYELKDGRRGVLFSPYPDDINTSIYAEKTKLKVKVKTDEDLAVIREAFHEAIKALPGVEIEMLDESLSSSINLFEAKYSFLDGDVRRKRWVKNIYWGRTQFVIIAQGRTEEDYQYWLPMLYNTMMTVKIM